VGSVQTLYRSGILHPKTRSPELPWSLPRFPHHALANFAGIVASWTTKLPPGSTSQRPKLGRALCVTKRLVHGPQMSAAWRSMCEASVVGLRGGGNAPWAGMEVRGPFSWVCFIILFSIPFLFFLFSNLNLNSNLHSNFV
jgi:hypothetical protein